MSIHKEKSYLLSQKVVKVWGSLVSAYNAIANNPTNLDLDWCNENAVMQKFREIPAQDRPNEECWKMFYREYNQAQEDASSGDEARVNQAGVNMTYLQNKIYKEIIKEMMRQTNFI